MAKTTLPYPEEYTSTLCEGLKEWRKEKNSWTIPQFLHKYTIGWSLLKELIGRCPQLRNEFEVTLAALADKWMMYAFASPKMPKHMQKALCRYLSIYDEHLLYVETEMKKSIAREETRSVMEYVVEDYGKEVLKGLYDELYQSNVKKVKHDR